jgi:hypothetical protein
MEFTLKDSPQNAYSTRSFIGLLKNEDSDFFTEQILDLVNEHRIALSLISEDKDLLQKFKTALSRANGSTPEEHHLAKC